MLRYSPLLIAPLLLLGWGMWSDAKAPRTLNVESLATSGGAERVETELLIQPPTSEVLESRPGVAYRLDQVRRWAAAFSPEANLLESESRAIMQSVDPDDKEACCSARLVRSVLHEVALGRRADSALTAAKAYHQWLAAGKAQSIASQALETQAELIALAQRAQSLEIKDGDVLQLQQQAVQLEGLEIVQQLTGQKLRQELARVTGRDESEVAVAFPAEDLPRQAPRVQAGETVAAALAQRHDLKAIAILCQKMNRCNLPAARQLLMALNPGVGLSLSSLSGRAGAATCGLLGCLKKDNSDADFATRQQQCRDLHQSLTRTVRNQALQAVLDIRLAQRQVDLIFREIEILEQRYERVSSEVKIEQALPGSELIVALELFDLRANAIQRQLDLAIAIDVWHHVRNDSIPSLPN